MKQHLSVVTLGVRDLARAKQFYSDGLGWTVSAEQGRWVLFKLGNGSAALALYPWDALADDAGGAIVKPAQPTDWGGYGGYFADPDGYLWEVASGATQLPFAE